MLDGGAHILMVETVFDTLNAKAALYAIEDVFKKVGARMPVMVSFTAVDLSGRNLSGQTVEAFCASVSHVPLLSVGLNCSLGSEQLRPFLADLSDASPHFVSCHPNAGLPNELGGLRRVRSRNGRQSARVRPKRTRQYSGKLLRLNPRAHARDSGSSRGRNSAQTPQRIHKHHLERS